MPIGLLANPVVLGSIISGLGSLFGGMFGGDSGQERESFKGTAVDPERLLSEGMGATRSLFSALSNKANAPRRLDSAYAQPVPGLSGTDPAYKDRSLLDLQPLNLGFSLPPGQTDATGRQPRQGTPKGPAVVGQQPWLGGPPPGTPASRIPFMGQSDPGQQNPMQDPRLRAALSLVGR